MMKTLVTLFTFFICFTIQAQDYPFIADSLKLLPKEELFKNPPPTTLDLVYFEDGTPTTLNEAISLFMTGKYSPKMYVDGNGTYIALVAVEVGDVDVKIEYENVPDSIVDLGYSIGNPKSDKVILFTQGGPLYNLLIDNFENFFMNSINLNEVFLINVHQFQTLNPDVFQKEEIPFEEAKKYGEKTTEMLYDVVNFFKSQGKEVYIVGVSFGAFAGADLIANYGNIADGYILMAGRLDMTDSVWKAYSKGINITRNQDAIGVTTGKKSTSASSINQKKIAAAFGYKRYTELLKDIDLSNLIYAYGKKDLSVGRLTDAEIKFLKLKKAVVMESEKGHSEVQGDYLKKALALFLED